MTARADELRAARELFVRAQEAGTTPDSLRRRDAMIRWEAADRRLAKRRQGEDVGQDLKWFQK